MLEGNKDKDLTIIVVTHNSSAVIGNCLQEIKNLSYPLILLDCKSSDDSLSLLERCNHNSMVIGSDKNLGYGRANNLAMKYVKTKYALFLNPDAIIKAKDIEAIIKVLEQRDDIAIAGPTIVGKKKKKEDEPGIIFERSILGAALFVRTDLFKKLGGFDENIFMYGDENDLCSRVEKSGYKNAVITQAKASHINRGSTPKKWQYDYLRGFHTCWSKLYLRKKNKGTYRVSYIVPKFILRSLYWLLVAIISFNKHQAAWHLGGFFGSLTFLFGLDAFNKQDNPRGFILS